MPDIACSRSSKAALAGSEVERAHWPGCLTAPQWGAENWLLHGFSTRIGGISRLSESHSTAELNLGYAAIDDPSAVSANRRRFMAAIERNGNVRCGLVTLRQMHSGLVRRVGRDDAGEKTSIWGDGLMTDEPGVLLGIQTADCLPILIADPRRRAVAAFHAGWRGTLKGIAERGVASMRREFGSDPADLAAAIGPGIGSCCFTVGPELRPLFEAKYPYAASFFAGVAPSRMNLVEANRLQLLSAGLRTENIHCLDLCTSCDTARFFSYRAEGGKTGRMMAVIGVDPRLAEPGFLSIPRASAPQPSARPR